MKSIRIFLLVLIVIGLGLLFTQSMWVPKLVNRIVEREYPLKTVEATSSVHPLSIEDAIVLIGKKYSYGTPNIIATDTSRVWFDVPHEAEGCGRYRFIDLTSGVETITELAACPRISVLDSYPFYVDADCSFSRCYDFKTLYVVNMRTLERRAVHSLVKAGETTIQNCHDTDFDPVCSSGISLTDGVLRIPIYRERNRKPYEIYQNGEPIRVDTVDLSKPSDN